MKNKSKLFNACMDVLLKTDVVENFRLDIQEVTDENPEEGNPLKILWLAFIKIADYLSVEH